MPLERKKAVYKQYRRNRYQQKRRRYACMSCGAQFWDREEDKMWAHSRPGFHSAYGHGGFRTVPRR